MLSLFVSTRPIRTILQAVDITITDLMTVLLRLVYPVVSCFDMLDVLKVYFVHRNGLLDMLDTFHLYGFLRRRFPKDSLQDLTRSAFGNGIDASDASCERFILGQVITYVFVNLFV